MKVIYSIGQYLIRAVACTWKISISAQLPAKPSVIAFWHGEMLPVWKIFSRKNATAIVSLSNDGEILTSLLKKWQYKLIRGSSSKNGSKVLSEMANVLQNGIVMITPDGPRGPRMQCKPGALIAAQKMQAPLYFIRCSIHYKKIFIKSWDKFEFPLPFSKIKINISEPMYLSSELDREAMLDKMKGIDLLFGEK